MGRGRFFAFDKSVKSELRRTIVKKRINVKTIRYCLENGFVHTRSKYGIASDSGTRTSEFYGPRRQ